jgi:hypothetical protein
MSSGVVGIYNIIRQPSAVRRTAAATCTFKTRQRTYHIYILLYYCVCEYTCVKRLSTRIMDTQVPGFHAIEQRPASVRRSVATCMTRPARSNRRCTARHKFGRLAIPVSHERVVVVRRANRAIRHNGRHRFTQYSAPTIIIGIIICEFLTDS